MLDVKEIPNAVSVSSLRPQELLKLDSINGIPINTLNKYLKPNK